MENSDFQTALHDLTCHFFVLIKGVGVDIQRGGRLTVTEQPRNCSDIRRACNPSRRPVGSSHHVF